MKNLMDELRNEFGFYRKNKEIIYLDYSATTFMPDIVTDAWNDYHTSISLSANRNRSYLGIKASEVLQQSREKISGFFDSKNEYDLVFTKNATESLNIIANGIKDELLPGDIILISSLEHHSNILPWSKIAKEKDAILVLIPLNKDGNLNYDILDELKGKCVKVISVSLVSNVTGHKIDHKRIYDFAKQEKAKYILDISQAVAHEKLNLNEYGADMFALSAHKMYGPKSIGGLFIKKELIERVKPYMLGGGMVWSSVGTNKEWAKGTSKFEAGTTDVALAYSWSKACKFINDVGFNTIGEINSYIYERLYSEMAQISEVELINNGKNHISSLLTFDYNNLHSHDLEVLLDEKNIVLRTGHMCSQNTMRELNKVSLNRLSWGLGVTDKNIDEFLNAIRNIKK